MHFYLKVPIPVKFHTYETKGKIVFVNECLMPFSEMTNCNKTRAPIKYAGKRAEYECKLTVIYDTENQGSV